MNSFSKRRLLVRLQDSNDAEIPDMSLDLLDELDGSADSAADEDGHCIFAESAPHLVVRVSCKQRWQN